MSGESITTKLILPNTEDLDPSKSVTAETKTRATYSKQSAVANATRVSLAFVFFMVPAFVHAGVFGFVMGLMEEERAVAEASAPTYSAQTVPLLRAAVHADPNAGKGGGDIVVDEDGVLVPALGPDGVPSEGASKSTGEIIIYVVNEGDDLGHIAQMFDVSVNTILWANNIKNAKTIQPGQELLILPISGVRHIVKSGDSLKAIAKKYHAEAKAEEIEEIMAEIIDYNRLADASDLTPGATVVIPGGEVIVPVAARKVAGGAPSGGAAVSGFAKPLKSYTRTQGIHGYNGVDLAAPSGAAVYASAPGTVIVARGYGWNGGYGSYVVIKHGNGTQTLYAHLSSVAVSAGATVAQGDYIGGVGNTGRSTGTHLHFEVRGAKNPF